MQNTDGPCMCMRTFRGAKTLTRSLTCEKIGLALLEYDVTCPSCPNCAVLPYDKDPWWGWGQSDLLPLSWESSLKRRQIMMKFTTPSVYRTPYAFSWNVWKIQIPNSTQHIVIFWGIISSCLQDSFEMWTTKPWTFSVGLMLSLQTSQFGARISKLMLPFFLKPSSSIENRIILWLFWPGIIFHVPKSIFKIDSQLPANGMRLPNGQMKAFKYDIKTY